ANTSSSPPVLAAPFLKSSRWRCRKGRLDDQTFEETFTRFMRNPVAGSGYSCGRQLSRHMDAERREIEIRSGSGAQESDNETGGRSRRRSERNRRPRQRRRLK